MSSHQNRRRRLLLSAIAVGLIIAVSVASSFIQMHRLALAATAHHEATEQLTPLTGIRQNGGQLLLDATQLLLTEDEGNLGTALADSIVALRQSFGSLEALLAATSGDASVIDRLSIVRDRSNEMIVTAEALLRAAEAEQWHSVRDRAARLSKQQAELGLVSDQLIESLHETDQELSSMLRSARRQAAVPLLLSILGLVLGAIFLIFTMQPTSEPWVKSAHLSMIERMSSLLSLAQDLNQLFDSVRQELFTQVEAVCMSIMMLSDDGEQLEWAYRYEHGEEKDVTLADPVPVSRGPSGQVARSGQMLIVNDGVHADQQELGTATLGRGVVVWLGLPLVVAGELVGILVIENDQPFPERTVQLMSIVSGPVAIAIHNFIQFENVKAARVVQARQQVQLQAAAELAAAARSTRQLDELMRQAVALIQERFHHHFVGIYLVDRDSGKAVLKAGTGDAGRMQISSGYHLTIGGPSTVGAVTKDGKPRVVQDVTLDEGWSPNPYLPETRSELVVPLRVRENVIGALAVQEDRTQAFGSEIKNTLQAMGDQLAVAIENTQLLVRAENKARQQQQLNELSAQLYRASDVPEIVGIGLRALSERFSDSVIQLALGVTDQGGRLGAAPSQFAVSDHDDRPPD